ncbi:hypothetical protein GOP47_0003653 [Adiantum capillus-veneris]|uniref:Uncharacterized protein n=1 Tax=Adiantum capillus-veneris TaxID=13818 RepID=A0A9D4ZPL4_ADICA|nr:hypothetical protein GOP47_0003653 [Adiantum capillus-veneris]
MSVPIELASVRLLLIADLLLLLFCSCYVDESNSSFDISDVDAYVVGSPKEADSAAGARDLAEDVQPLIADNVVYLGRRLQGWRCQYRTHEYYIERGPEQSWHRKLGSDRLLVVYECRPLSSNDGEAGLHNMRREEEEYNDDNMEEAAGGLGELYAPEEIVAAAGRGPVLMCAFLRRHPAFFLHLAVAFLLFALLAALLYFILDNQP